MSLTRNKSTFYARDSQTNFSYSNLFRSLLLFMQFGFAWGQVNSANSMSMNNSETMFVKYHTDSDAAMWPKIMIVALLVGFCAAIMCLKCLCKNKSAVNPSYEYNDLYVANEITDKYLQSDIEVGATYKP